MLLRDVINQCNMPLSKLVEQMDLHRTTPKGAIGKAWQGLNKLNGDKCAFVNEYKLNRVKTHYWEEQLKMDPNNDGEFMVERKLIVVCERTKGLCIN